MFCRWFVVYNDHKRYHTIGNRSWQLGNIPNLESVVSFYTSIHVFFLFVSVNVYYVCGINKKNVICSLINTYLEQSSIYISRNRHCAIY